MVERTIAETADRMSQRRSRMLPVLAVFYLMQQVSYFSARHDDPWRTVDHVRVSAWLVMSVVLLAAVMTGGSWLRSKDVRRLMNDEVAQANRAKGIELGFVIAMVTGIGLYFVSLFEPLGGRDAVHAILSLGIGAALLRFGFLERRAHRGA